MSSSTSKLDEDEGEPTSTDLDQLVCQLKDAVFDKYVSNYLLKKAEKVIDIDSFLIC